MVNTRVKKTYTRTYRNLQNILVPSKTQSRKATQYNTTTQTIFDATKIIIALYKEAIRLFRGIKSLRKHPQKTTLQFSIIYWNGNKQHLIMRKRKHINTTLSTKLSTWKTSKKNRRSDPQEKKHTNKPLWRNFRETKKKMQLFCVTMRIKKFGRKAEYFSAKKFSRKTQFSRKRNIFHCQS